MPAFAAPPMPTSGAELTGQPLAAPNERLTNRLGARLKRGVRKQQIRLGQVHPVTPREFDGLGHEGY